MKTALVHYWLVNMRGGEQVLKSLMDFHPDADVITNVYDPRKAGELFVDRKQPITTSVNKLPFAKTLYPAYFSAMPFALEAVDLNDYELIISSESGPAKWVIPAPNARHICYVHSPMRYLWDQRNIYRNRLPAVARPAFDVITSYMRDRDVLSSTRVDQFVANSTFVAARIRQYYRRSAIVVPPPVTQNDLLSPHEGEDYYLYAGQLVSYKNAKAAVNACVTLKKRLIVVGEGPDGSYIKQFADRGVEYRGRVSRLELVNLMNRCKALIFPGIEDFGIIPVEVLASGRPVIALGKGGATDYLQNRKTGIFFERPDEVSICRAIEVFEDWLPDFEPAHAVRVASAYSPENFISRWAAVIDRGDTAEGRDE